MTGEVLDGFPAFRQSQVINNLIAAVQRIPERTTSLQSRQNLHVVDRTYADNEVAVFLTVLVCCTNFALLALRDVHDSVGEQSRFITSSLVIRQVTNLVHQEVARAGKVEVAGAEPRTTSDRVGNGLGGGVRIVTELCTRDIAACVIDPDRTECNLRVRVRLGSRKSRRQVVGEVRGVTILDRRLCLGVGIRLQTNTQLVTAVHDASFTVGAVATTGRQNHGDSIGRQDSTGINVTAVSAHQSVHVPVTVIDVRNRVQNIVAGRTIVLVGTEATTLVVITRTGVGITSNVGIIPRTGISVHGIVTDTHAVALTQEAFDGIIGFTGDIRLLLYTNAPTNGVDTVVAFGVHHVHFRIGIEPLGSNRKHCDVLVHMRTIIVAQPTIVGNIVDVVRVNTTCIRNPRVQEDNGILVLRTRSASTVVVLIGIADNSSVRRNLNSSTGDGPSVVTVMRTEIDGLTIPFGVDFEHIAIRQRELHVLTSCTSGKAVIVQNISGSDL